MRICSVDKCGGSHCARGLCRPHYNIARKGGAFTPKPYGVKPEVHFFAKVDVGGVCWEWTASLDRDGYGEFQEYIPASGGSRKWIAHRWCWEHLVGPIPDGMVLDHLCMNKKCVMPDHLEVVTVEENNRRYHALMGIGIYRGRGSNGRP